MTTTSTDRPAVQGVRLGELAERVPGARLLGDANLVVRGVCQDSRRVQPGDLFVARRGAKTDGRSYVPEALSRGAVAVLTDDASSVSSHGVSVVLVPDVRSLIGLVADVVYGQPYSSLQVIGITGTNGKTTTALLTQALLRATGAKAAVVGTLGCRFGEFELPAAHTTPEADETARVAAQLVARGVTHLVMEVSSHALSLSRVDAIPFRVAAFTNLSHDHLDFHGTLEEYGEQKARLFTELAPEASVINVDDSFGRSLAERARGGCWRVSPSGETKADIQVLERTWSAHGVRASVATPQGVIALDAPFVGVHNLENLCVALGVAHALGVPAEEAAHALAKAPAVPGRLERCSALSDNISVLVDYAHTPDALSRVLTSLRPLTKGALWCVFGCGGDRDTAKRRLMGEAAARLADHLVVTNDNPRTEPPETIAAAIVAGIKSAGRTCQVLLDRAEAIEHAVRSAQAGDTVLIAGKGHETYQILGDTTRAFDDRVEARRALPLRAQAVPCGRR